MSARQLRFNKDVLAGLMFAGVGAAFLWLSRDYDMGTGRRMGPGLFPAILSGALIVIGLATLLRGWLAPGGRIDQIAWRGVVAVIGGTILFGALLPTAGLLPAAIALIVVAALGDSQHRWREIVPLALGLGAFAVLVFVLGLGLPLRAFAIPFGG